MWLGKKALDFSRVFKKLPKLVKIVYTSLYNCAMKFVALGCYWCQCFLIAVSDLSWQKIP